MMYAKKESVLICAATKSTYTSLLKVGDFLKGKIRLHQLSLDTFSCINTMYLSHNSIIKIRKFNFSHEHVMLKLWEFNSLYHINGDFDTNIVPSNHMYSTMYKVHLLQLPI